MIVRTHTTQLVVNRLPRLGTGPQGRARGVLLAAGTPFPCVLGRGGIKALKREGDGATPAGVYALRRQFYRGDRVRRPVGSGLPVATIRPDDGWCDAPLDRNYNRPVRHPYPASAERLWRSDGLYDHVLVIGHNDAPRVRGRGSAVFLHVAKGGIRDGFWPTEGCVALERRHVAMLLSRIGRRTRLVVKI